MNARNFGQCVLYEIFLITRVDRLALVNPLALGKRSAGSDPGCRVGGCVRYFFKLGQGAPFLPRIYRRFLQLIVKNDQMYIKILAGLRLLSSRKL